MRLNNTLYCAVSKENEFCCKVLQQLNSCNGIEYPYYCEDSDYFANLSTWFEIPVDCIDIVLSTVIILISIFGKIDGTFKWCIMNIAIFHLLYPLISRFLMMEFLSKLPWTRGYHWSQEAANLFLNGILAIGTQGVTTSIAASLPLALNRYLLTHKSDLYKFFFGNNKRVFFFIFGYDVIVFGIFYIMYILITLSDLHFIYNFPYIAYYITSISTIVVTNSISLILMIFVLVHIYSSLKLVKKLDQKQMIIERKRIAWVIICQNMINFFLCASRIMAFYNVSQSFGHLPTIDCYNTFGNFYNYFGQVFQEIFVCMDGLIYIFYLTPYREALFKFFRKVLRRDKVHVLIVSNNSIFKPGNNNVAR